MVITSICKLGAICDSSVGTLSKVCNLEGGARGGGGKRGGGWGGRVGGSKKKKMLKNFGGS